MDDDFLTNAVQEFLANTGMTPTRFGQEAVKDPCFVAELLAGREPRKKTRQRVLSYIQNNPPPDHANGQQETGQ